MVLLREFEEALGKCVAGEFQDFCALSSSLCLVLEFDDVNSAASGCLLPF